MKSTITPRPSSTFGRSWDTGGFAVLQPGRCLAPSAVTGRLVGRERDVGQVAGLLRRGWLVTLTGAPGVGKSRLALHVAATQELAGVEVAVLSLGAICDRVAVRRAVAEALGIDDSAGNVWAAAVTPNECGRLVVLDDCDDIRPLVAELAKALIATGVRVLVTSRRSLDMPGEAVWAVGPLSLLPGGNDTSPGVDVDCDAVRLFRHRAAAGRGRSAVARDPAAVASICRRLDGLPLAIELAARRVDVLSPAEILARLERDPVTFLAATGRDDPLRRGLWASVQASYDRLSASERLLWARLSVFAGGFALNAAEAVCAGDEISGEQAFESVTALVAGSLIETDTTPTPSHYRLLEPLRHYARQRLEEADEAAALAAAHARWCHELTEQAGAQGHARRWAARLAPEHANIEAAWRWALGAEKAELAVGLGRAHAHLCEAVGRHGEARAAFEQVVALAATAPGALGATTLYEAGRAVAVTGDFTTARARIDHSVALARRTGDVGAEARALALASWVDTVRGVNAGTLSAVEHAVALARGTNDECSLADSLIAAGRAQLLVGQAAEARASFAESLALGRRLADEAATANALVGGGQATLVQGNYLEAEAMLTEGRALTTEAGEPYAHSLAIAGLGELARLRGHHATAKQHFRHCARLAREATMAEPLALALLGLGRVAQAAGEAPAAERLLQKALAVARDSTLAHVVPFCLVGLAQLSRAADNAQPAEHLLAAGLEAARRCGDKTAAAEALAELGRMALAAGDGRAASLHHQALKLQADIGNPAGIASCMECLARTATTTGAFTHATRLLGATHRIRETHGCVATPESHGDYGAHLRSARQHLGDEAFEIVWGQGTRLSTDEAIAYASKRRGPRKRPRSGWAALTPAEHRVVALTRQGLTNAQIAHRLLISRRTVDAHLAHVYPKLGINTRMQLTTFQSE